MDLKENIKNLFINHLIFDYIIGIKELFTSYKG